jgi:hypothetical protein
MQSSSSSSGKEVKVAYAQTAMEAEMIQGLLSDHGIPSVLKRPYGFGSSYAMLGAGPHQIFVPESAAERAREILAGPAGQE